MVINAFNSGARVRLADPEDANTHWHNVVSGQVNLYDAVRSTIELTTAEGKHSALLDHDDVPVILPRPRGWHFDEAHLTLDGRQVVAALVDFGPYFLRSAAELVARGSGPYFYLPNAPMLESYSDLLVKTCHRRHSRLHPVVTRRRVNEAAFAKVREDKRREADAGFDGSWVAHPDLVSCAEIFGEVLAVDNRVDRQTTTSRSRRGPWWRSS